MMIPISPRWCVCLAALYAAVQPPALDAQRPPQRRVLVRDGVFGAREGASALSSVADVTVGRDGSLYVADGQAHAVRGFSADGRRVSTLGREGRGPGEFQSPASLGWRGDTLVASDPFASRLVGFLPGGRHAFTRTFTALDGFLPRMILADGRTLGARILLSKDVAEGRQTTTDRLIAESPAGPARVIARLPLRHHMAHVRVGSGDNASEAFFAQPFGDWDLHGVDPRGRWIVSVSRPAAESARSRFAVTWRSPSGATLRTSTVPYAPAPLARGAVRDTIAAYAKEFARVFPGLSETRLAGMIRATVFVPRNLPPVASLVAGLDGSTWVRRAGAGPTATWMVFDERGRHVAYVTAPAEARLRAADRNTAWAVEKDADDVPYVVRYRVQPAR